MKQAIREIETKTLMFLKEIVEIQTLADRCWCIENPQSSDLWRTPPLTAMKDLFGGIPQDLHLCMFGLTDPANHQPVKKATRLLATVSTSTSSWWVQ